MEHMFVKEPVPRKKNANNSTIKKTNYQFKNWAKDLKAISPKKIHK
jgi:hypothetical protein